MNYGLYNKITFYVFSYLFCLDINITMKRVTELKKCNGTEKL